MKSADILQLFADKGALRTGDHFVYKSGKHGTVYFAKKLLLEDREIMNMIVAALAEILRCRDEIPTAIVGPQTGGALIVKRLSELFGEIGINLPAVAAEKDGEGFKFNPEDIPLIAGGRIVLIEDVLNSGTTVKLVLSLLQNLACEVDLVLAIVNRGTVTSADLGNIPLIALANAPQVQYEESDCPECRAGVSINTRFGHGADFLAKRSSPPRSP